jgi:choline dehydrogenase-like flavoprotein
VTVDFDFVIVGAGAAGCALASRLYAYHYPTRPVGPGGQVEAWMRGKVLGGSTAVNGIMWTRGTAADWDGLAVRGNPEFGWKRVLAAWLDHLPRVGASATDRGSRDGGRLDRRRPHPRRLIVRR